MSGFPQYEGIGAKRVRQTLNMCAVDFSWVEVASEVEQVCFMFALRPSVRPCGTCVGESDWDVRMTSTLRPFALGRR
jgi:hypothetical protein